MAHQEAIADAGCDYLRLTIQPGNAGFPECMNLWQQGIQTEADKGHQTRKCHLQGYDGLICGGYFYGLRADGMMCQVSGAASNNVIHRLRDVELDCNVPRCDVQDTINGKKTHVPRLAEIKRRLKTAERQDPRRIERSTALYENKKKADTLYIGARSSGHFLRIYSASAVHPESYPAHHWRFEVQAGKREAPTIFSALRRADSLTHCASSFVIGHLMSIGLSFDWYGAEVPTMPATQYRKTDAERRLHWIEFHVKRTFWWLIQHGYSRALEKALDLAPGTLPDGGFSADQQKEVG